MLVKCRISLFFRRPEQIRASANTPLIHRPARHASEEQNDHQHVGSHYKLAVVAIAKTPGF